MKVKDDTVVMPDQPCMRHALDVAEKLWEDEGEADGITVTSGKDGVHGAGSWHYCGAAFDLRTHYWEVDKQKRVYKKLKQALPEYDIVYHADHIHVEPGNVLAKKWGLML